MRKFPHTRFWKWIKIVPGKWGGLNVVMTHGERSIVLARDLKEREADHARAEACRLLNDIHGAMVEDAFDGVKTLFLACVGRRNAKWKVPRLRRGRKGDFSNAAKGADNLD